MKTIEEGLTYLRSLTVADHSGHMHDSEIARAEGFLRAIRLLDGFANPCGQICKYIGLPPAKCSHDREIAFVLESLKSQSFHDRGKDLFQCCSCGATYERRYGCPNDCNDESYG